MLCLEEIIQLGREHEARPSCEGLKYIESILMWLTNTGTQIQTVIKPK